MNTHQQTPCCKVISIASARPATVQHKVALLALVRGQRPLNLARLAQSILTDPNLSYQVTEAACQEFGYAWLSVEQAILLLGRQRLSMLLSGPVSYGRSARQLQHLLRSNGFTPADSLRPSKDFQEESK